MEKIVEQGLLYDFYGQLLTAHQQKIYELAVYENLSYNEIAEQEGISRQGVRDSIKRGESTLKELEDQLQFAGRFEQLTAYSRVIRKYAKDILAYVDSRGYTEQIRRAANEIVECANQLDSFVEGDD